MKSFRMSQYVSYLVLISSICFSCQSSHSNTRIIVKEIIDLGAIKVGEKVNFAIDLLNHTDQDLKIVNVKGSCECVTINTCPSELKPQQSGTINATYTSKFERKLSGVLFKDVVIQLNKKPFIQSVKVKVDIK